MEQPALKSGKTTTWLPAQDVRTLGHKMNAQKTMIGIGSSGLLRSFKNRAKIGELHYLRRAGSWGRESPRLCRARPWQRRYARPGVSAQQIAVEIAAHPLFNFGRSQSFGCLIRLIAVEFRMEVKFGSFVMAITWMNARLPVRPIVTV